MASISSRVPAWLPKSLILVGVGAIATVVYFMVAPTAVVLDGVTIDCGSLIDPGVSDPAGYELCDASREQSTSSYTAALYVGLVLLVSALVLMLPRCLDLAHPRVVKGPVGPLARSRRFDLVALGADDDRELLDFLDDDVLARAGAGPEFVREISTMFGYCVDQRQRGHPAHLLLRKRKNGGIVTYFRVEAVTDIPSEITTEAFGQIATLSSVTDEEVSSGPLGLEALRLAVTWLWNGAGFDGVLLTAVNDAEEALVEAIGARPAMDSMVDFPDGSQRRCTTYVALSLAAQRRVAVETARSRHITRA